MSRQFDHLPDVEAFVAVAQRLSMTEAAVALSTTPSVLSRAITRLETHLGVQLLRRTTRRLSLTDAGRDYLAQAQDAFAQIADAERSLQARNPAACEIGGRVRLSAPTTYGHYRLAPMIARFMQIHPQVEVELGITNRNVDLIAEGYDLAIRLGQLHDSGLTGRRLEEVPLKLVASPDYVRRCGAPESLDALRSHDLLPFVMPSTGRPGSWDFLVDGRPMQWQPLGRLRVHDDVLGCVTLAELGAGICQTYDFIVADRIAQGRLVELLPKFGASRPFSMLFAAHRHMSPATRQLVNFLAEGAGRARREISS